MFVLIFNGFWIDGGVVVGVDLRSFLPLFVPWTVGLYFILLFVRIQVVSFRVEYFERVRILRPFGGVNPSGRGGSGSSFCRLIGVCN